MSPAPVIIAIDGRSGAGKTTLAIELAARLRNHHKVSLFHLEDIYPGWNGLAAGIERYVSTVLDAAEPRRSRHLDQLGLGKTLRRRHPGHAARRDRDHRGSRRRSRRGPAPARAPSSGPTRRTTSAGRGRWTVTAEPTSRSGTSGPPRRTNGSPADDVAGPRGHPRAEPGRRRGPGRCPAAPDLPALRWHRSWSPSCPPAAASGSVRNGWTAARTPPNSSPALYGGSRQRRLAGLLQRLHPEPAGWSSPPPPSAAASASWRTTAARSARRSRTVPARA